MLCAGDCLYELCDGEYMYEVSLFRPCLGGVPEDADSCGTLSADLRSGMGGGGIVGSNLGTSGNSGEPVILDKDM